MRHSLQISEFLSSLPLKSPNSTMGLSDFSQSDTKNHLKTLPPHDHMSLPPKTLSMAAAGLLSSTSRSPFGCSIAASSSSSSSSLLQLCPDSSSTSFENGQKPPLPVAASLMSATALLQKAAQMGATASTKMNNSLIEGFGTNMAPTQFGEALLTNSIQYDHHLQADQTQYLNQMFDQNGGAESEVMNEMGMFSVLFDQNHGVFKNMEPEHGSRNNIFAAKTANQPGLSTPRNGKPDTMTVDFLGVGAAGPGNFHEQMRQQRQDILEVMTINHPRMKGFSSFEEQVSHGEAAMEKAMWEV